MIVHIRDCLVRLSLDFLVNRCLVAIILVVMLVTKVLQYMWRLFWISIKLI